MFPLMNKVDNIYIFAVPWFRFTLMDLNFRVLFHRLIPNNIRQDKD